MTKTNSGRFFEDYRLGETIVHGVPRTLGPGLRDLYTALYPSRFALYSADSFARAVGLERSPVEDLAVFHTVFGKSVPDISLNAIANLGYAEGRFHRPVWPGATLSATSEVIGLRQLSNGKAGIVWVRTTGRNEDGATVLEYVRWVMVRRRAPGSPASEDVVPALSPHVAATDLILPDGLSFADYDFAASGEAHRWADYAVGEHIDHVDGVTVEEAEHMLATRLWQNTAKVHFDVSARQDGRRLIYGGHVISLARALSFNGLANAQMIVAINAGSHAAPCFAGDTVRAWSEILEVAETAERSIGALRIRLVATTGTDDPFPLKDAEGRYRPEILLDFDYWALVPR
ncbi:MAG: MaoC family dehydratase [Pseudomonadota bacterium]